MPGLVVPLPLPGGGWSDYQVPAQRDWPDRAAPARSRIMFAATHVVADAAAPTTLRTVIDRHRRYLSGLGNGRPGPC